MKIGAMSRMPCSVCEIVPKRDGLTSVGVLRDAEVMRALMPFNSWKPVAKEVQQHLRDHWSINIEYNHCWWVPGYNPFRNPGCILHQFDHGIFDLLLEDTVAFLAKYYPKKTVAQFDLCWEDLIAAPGGKVFRRGVSSLANASCAELRIVSMGLPFALRGVPAETTQTNEAELPPFFLQSIACTYLQLRWLLSLKRLTSRVTDMIQLVCSDLLIEMNRLHCAVNNDIPIEHGIKFHKLRHWAEWIRMFGASENWSTEVWEGAHKLVKRYKSTLNWTNPSSAPQRVAFLHSVWDVHETPLDDSDGRHRPRTIPCGFRGKTSLSSLIAMTKPAADYLTWWERTSEREFIAIDEAVAYYLTWSGITEATERDKLSAIMTLLYR